MCNMSVCTIVCTTVGRPNVPDYVLAVYQVVTGALGILGNVILLLAMKRHELFKQSGYIIIAHYTLPDFGQGLLCLLHTPWVVLRQAYLLQDTQYAELERWLVSIAFVAPVFGLKFLIGFTAISRYCVICHPFIGRTQFNRRNTNKWLAVTWLVALVGNGPLYLNWYFNYKERDWRTCPETPWWISTYGFSLNAIASGLMAVLYPICFRRIVKARRKVSRSMSWTSDDEQRDMCLISKTEMRVLRLFVINSLVFTAYWLPYYLVEQFHVDFKYGPQFMEYMRGILVSYNPIMYYLVNSKIRAAINQLLTGGKYPAPAGAVPRLSAQQRRRSTVTHVQPMALSATVNSGAVCIHF